MKSPFLVLLGISAIVNAVLLVGDPRAPFAARPDAAGPGGGRVTPPAATRAAGAAHAARLASARTQILGALESADLATLRDRLRAEGCPETVVRAIIGRRLDDAIEARRVAHWGVPVVEPFWKTRDPAAERERRSFERQLSRELRAQYASLLGAGPVDPGMRAFAGDRFGFLPPEKAQLLQSIELDYAEIGADARGDFMMGGVSAEDRERQEMLEREKRADIAATLTPEEFERYELYYSPAASAARNRFRSFEPTEEEFRAVYALQKVIDERYGAMSGPLTGADAAARSAAQNELNTQLKTVLGAERYAEFERVNSPGYRAAVRIADHFNLPRENADAVYALEVEYRNRRAEVTRGATTPAQRTEAIQALATEAAARVSVLLGAEGTQVLREHSGSWLHNLGQMPAQSPPPRP